IIGRTHHLHTINIMCFTVRTTMAFKLMPYIVRESSSSKYRWLIHVIPKSCNAIFYQTFVQSTPPRPDLRICKIWELTSSRPYKTFHKVIIPPTAEIIVLLALLENPIAIIHLDPGINHHHSFKAIGIQIRNHLLRIWEIALVPSKTTVAIHIIDI